MANIKISVKGLHKDAKNYIERFIKEYEEVLDISDEPFLYGLASCYDTMIKSREAMDGNIVVEGTRGMMVNPYLTAHNTSMCKIESATSKMQRRLEKHKNEIKSKGKDNGREFDL